jgi:radical SAM protein with 4Fe4S-binding SPASM domain
MSALGLDHSNPAEVAAKPLFLRQDAHVVWSGAEFQLSAPAADIFHPLSPAEALALLLLGQIGAISDVHRYLGRLGPAFPAALERVTHRFATYLGTGTGSRFDPAWWGEKLPFAKVRASNREAAPASITWMVTLECNRRCPYCFYKIIPARDGTRHRPRDATLSTQDALQMIEEMARIGTADLYLTGGEPLLRDDLPDLIASAAAFGIRPHVVTKYAIDRQMAERLAASHLHHLTISLDDLRTGPATQLTGVSDYPAQALASIERALEAGLNVEVNAVQTALNEDDLDKLGVRLAEMGVPRFTISPLQPPYFRNANVGKFLTIVRLDSVLDRVRAAVGDRMIVEGGGAASSDQGANQGCAPDLVCEVGTRSLHILPNGDVTRCHYLPDRPDLVVGSVKRSTIMEIWNGQRLFDLVDPRPDAYAETACHSCGGFKKCNARGRCVASAVLEHDRVFAPDAFCARGP